MGYRRAFLDGYIPNETYYLPEETRVRLDGMGRIYRDKQPAGTYAREIHNRLLIDLSWNSSRLEGNTYSLLETERLLELGAMADGKDVRETQMILNHKAAIELLLDDTIDPFGQAFFVMVQLPYLQPFMDVNKRVSRLAANIPLIRSNFCPLSFVHVPERYYTGGVLGIYELHAIAYLREVFVWSYQQSSDRYSAVRQTLGDPDPFVLRHRAKIKELVGGVVRGAMSKVAVIAWIRERTPEIKPDAARQRLIEMAETELMCLHPGNIARYKLRPSEFERWREAWCG